MKTLSKILKEIFALRRQDIQPNFQPLNSITDERETDESARVSGMDTSDSEEDSPNLQREQTIQSSEGEESAKLGGGSDGAEGSTPLQSEPGGDGSGAGEGADSELADKDVETAQNENLEDPEFLKAIEEAYQKGLKDGRNARIEERYFPKENDGVPHFRGGAVKIPSGGDIFSIAREA